MINGDRINGFICVVKKRWWIKLKNSWFTIRHAGIAATNFRNTACSFIFTQHTLRETIKILRVLIIIHTLTYFWFIHLLLVFLRSWKWWLQWNTWLELRTCITDAIEVRLIIIILWYFVFYFVHYFRVLTAIQRVCSIPFY